ncbi:MAG: hypothetical protein EOM67_14745, partial [Spirochaetia bacterium]|nr:hypothetical protein [Spirochaetia bacterium]
MSNLPNSKDTFQRVENKNYQENTHKILHNQLADTVEAIQKYSGSLHVTELPAESEVGVVYTLIQRSGEYQPGIYICVTDAPTYLPIASRGEGYIREYEIEDQTIFNVEHYLATKGIFAKVYDNDYNEVEYDELLLIDDNNLRVKFSSAFTGKLILLAGGKDGLAPEHQWDGPRIRFKNPNGSWGEWVDLKDGPGGGPMGPMPAHEWNGTQIRFQEPGGLWGEWVDVRGIPGPPGPEGVGEKGDPGNDGNDGQGITWKGTYSSLNTYDPYDLVHYNGNTYLKILESGPGINPTNTTYWDLHTSKGADGTAGLTTMNLEAGEDIKCEGIDEVAFVGTGVEDLKSDSPIVYNITYAKDYLGFAFKLTKVGTPIGPFTFRLYTVVDGMRGDLVEAFVFNASEISSG